MSIVANDVDTKLVRLRISDTRSHSSTYTLKKRLLKDSSKYSCIIQSLFTDSIPPLLSQDKVLLAILPKDDRHAAFPYVAVDRLQDPTAVNGPEFYKENKLVLQRKHHYNILQVIQFVSQFIDQFNRYIALYGTGVGDFTTEPQTADIIARLQDPAIVHKYSDYDPVRHVGFSVDASGRGQFFCSQLFLSNWFIYLDPDFAKRVGFESQYLWGGQDQANNNVTSGTVDEYIWELHQGNFRYKHEMTYTGGDTIFKSDYPFFLIDQRLTLDVELTIPVSKVVESNNGEYKEKFKLASFPIDSYIQTDAKVSTVDGIARPSIRIRDSLTGGLIDLCGGYAESIVKHFLPGSVQAINTRIFCSYRDWNGSKTELGFELDGFYDLELLFTKKVT